MSITDQVLRKQHYFWPIRKQTVQNEEEKKKQMNTLKSIVEQLR